MGVLRRHQLDLDGNGHVRLLVLSAGQLYATWFDSFASGYKSAGDDTQNGVACTHYKGDSSISSLYGSLAGVQGSFTAISGSPRTAAIRQGRPRVQCLGRWSGRRVRIHPRRDPRQRLEQRRRGALDRAAAELESQFVHARGPGGSPGPRSIDASLLDSPPDADGARATSDARSASRGVELAWRPLGWSLEPNSCRRSRSSWRRARPPTWPASSTSARGG